MKPAKPTRWQGSEQTKTVCAAFSLVELLIVIAIIALLAALLLPVVNNTKNQGAQAADFTNFHQIVMAVHVYTDDNKDIMPWSNWDYGASMPAGDSRPGWLYTPNPATNGPAAFDPRTGLLWDSLSGGDGRKIFLCPMDHTDQAGFSARFDCVTNRPQQLSSYVMNGAVNGFQSGYLSNSFCVKISQMLPTDCIQFEANEYEPFCFNDGANWPSEGLTQRHSQGGVEALLDGSSSYLSDETWNNELNDLNKNSLWCFPLTDDGGDEVQGHPLFND